MGLGGVAGGLFAAAAGGRGWGRWGERCGWAGGCGSGVGMEGAGRRGEGCSKRGTHRHRTQEHTSRPLFLDGKACNAILCNAM